MFSHFCLKTTKPPKVSTIPRFQCDSNTSVLSLTRCTPHVIHTKAPVLRRHCRSGSCFVVSSSKNQLGKETFLLLGVITVLALNPGTQHWTTRSRTMHHGLVCLSKLLDISTSESLDHSLLPTEEHELFYTDLGKDSLRKTNYNVDCHLNEIE